MMRRMIIGLCLLLAGMWEIGCQHSELSVADYQKWVEQEDNPTLIQDKTMGDLIFSAKYKPRSYVAMLHAGTTQIPPLRLQAMEDSLKGYEYFTFKIAHPNHNTELLKLNLNQQDEYFARVEYYSFGIQNDFFLISGQDTIPCALSHFERTYGLAPHATFTLSFECQRKVHEPLTLLYNEKVFGLGLIALRFEAENLNKIPSVSFF